MARSFVMARAFASGLAGVVALAMPATTPAALTLPAFLTPIGIALNLRELIEGATPEEAPERRFVAEGRAALDEGDIARAALAFEAALAANPDSIEALTLLGLIREQQGQPRHAAVLYRRALDVAALRRAAEIAAPPPPKPEPRVGAEDEGGTEVEAAEPVTPAWITLAALAEDRLAAMSPAATPPDDPRLSFVDRLAVLDALLANGAIAIEEHKRRRDSGLGALLVRTATAPSAALTAPAPTAEDVLGRFAQLDEHRAHGALTDEAWAMERAAILDALLPLDGPRLDGLAPLDEAMLAALVDRGVLRQEEARREIATTRTVVANVSSTAPPAVKTPPLPGSKPEPPPAALAVAEPEPESEPEPELAAAEPAEMPAPAPQEPLAVVPETAESTTAIGIHLASYRTPEQARQGWTELQTANADLLGALQARIAAVDRGDRGVYFEISAGPMADNAQALHTCAALVARGLYCATTLY